MLPLLLRLTPFSETEFDHPIFRYETRRLRYADTIADFLRYTLRWIGTGVLFAFGLMGAIAALALRSEAQLDPTFWGSTCTFALAASGIFGLALDYTSASAGLPAFGHELVSGRWQLLRLTPLREASIILAKHAAAQLRVWRLVMLMIGLRGGLLLIWVIALLIAGDSPMLIALAFTIISISAALEPIARLRGYSALGVYVSARVISGMGGQLLLWLYLSAFWFIQIVLLVALISLIGPFALLMMLSRDASWTAIWMVFVPATAVVFIGLALTVRAWALRATARYLMHSDDRR